MKPKISLLLVLGFSLGLCLFVFAGCRNSKVKEPVKPPVEKEDTEPVIKKPVTIPFVGDDVQLASKETRENLKPLFRFGYVLIGAGFLVSILLGLQAGAAVAGGGFLGVATAVLFSEFPRSVLLIPVLGTGVLIILGIFWIRRLWNAQKAMEILVSEVDKLDTGSKSPGRMLKQSLAKSGNDGIVRKGIEFIKKKFRRND